MSDTVSDLASRAQAREEVHAELVRIIKAPRMVTNTSDGRRNALADDILREFDALASLLGYVKADGGHWLVRRDGITYPNVFVDEAAARLWARDFTDRGAGCVFVRRCTADVEVVTDAEQG